MLFGKRENSIFFYFSEKYRILEKHLILNHYPDIVPPLGGHKGRPTTNEPLTFLIQSKTINGRGGPCGRPTGVQYPDSHFILFENIRAGPFAKTLRRSLRSAPPLRRRRAAAQALPIALLRRAASFFLFAQ